MKIEIGESVIYSWLRHIKGCKIVQTNWKTSPQWEGFHSEQVYALIEELKQSFPNIFKKSTNTQLLQQAEIDVLGVCFTGAGPFFYAVEVAFHEDGLLYGDDTAERVAKKLLRIALLLYLQFNTKQGEIIFATPKAHPKNLVQITQKIQDIAVFMQQKGFSYHFSFIANEMFEKEIIQPLQDVSASVSDTTELFLRSYKLFCLVQKNTKYADNFPNDRHTVQPTPTISLLRAIGMQFFIKYYDYFKKGISPKEMLSIITEDFTDNSKRNRCSTANRIFREQRQIEALELITKAQDIPQSTKNTAEALLIEEKHK